MRVLLVMGHSVPSRNALWHEVAERSVDLHVAYTPDVPRDPAPAPPEMGTLHALDGVRVRGDRHTWMAYRGLTDLVERLRPDVVHVINEPWAVTVSQLVGSPTRLVAHSAETIWDQGPLHERLIRRGLAQRNLRASAGLASWNTAGIVWARHLGLRPDAPTAVFSPEIPDPAQFDPVAIDTTTWRRRWEADASLVFGFVGRLVPEKGVDWLLEAWKQVDCDLDARLVFVGGGPLRPTIARAQAADPRIVPAGLLPPEDIPAAMAGFDALVLPSMTAAFWAEQWGRVLDEAMTVGVPVIASRTGSIPEVAGDAAVLIDEGDVTALAEAIIDLASNAQTRDQLGAAGRERAAREFSPAVGADRAIGLWERVIESAPPSERRSRFPGLGTRKPS